MPELRIGPQRLQVASGSNLLDELLADGQPVAWSCRSGHCQSCLVQAQPGQAPEAACSELDPEQQAQGWLLACQCQVRQDMDLHLLDPAQDGLPAQISRMEYLAENILLLGLHPERPLRYQAGQHLSLWLDAELARPYSIASLPGEPELQFHLALKAQGQFSQRIQRMNIGERIYLGRANGHCHYQSDWQDRPLLLLGRGTGLSPLQAVARDALKHGHRAAIELWHWHPESGDCYLRSELEKLAQAHPQTLRLHLHPQSQLSSDMASLRLASRHTLALVCGHPEFVEQWRKPLFMAGLPRRQVFDEAFVSRQ
ncbi:iron-sulfur-binding ferredoxin reductase [Halopseudomonas phragmitis]|nr:iron-sulfur-binding ferredoxin reductase [Halopseudomonas phragmitis]